MFRKINKEERINYIKNNPNKSLTEITKDLKTDLRQLRILCSEYGIDYQSLKRKKNKKYNGEQEVLNYIKNNATTSVSEIARNLNITRYYVCEIIKKHGLK